MNQTESKRHVGLKRLLILFGVLAVATVVLVACGGGGSQPATETVATAAPTDEKMAALAVPAGWVGRPPAYEVINGITVPPEPAPTLNNSTLAGIDVNKNGVRDDVERVIAGASKKTTFDAQTLPIAKFYNQLATSRFTTPEDAVDIVRKIYCLEVLRTPSERQTVSAEDIKQLTNNTSERTSNANANDTLITTKPVLVEGGFSCN